MKKLKRAIREFMLLTPDYRFLVVEAWLQGLVVMLVLRSPGWRYMIKKENSLDLPPPADDPELGKIAEIVSKTLSLHLRKTTCLERSITLQRVLCRRGLWVPLVIGAKKEGDGRVAAHAWLDHPSLPKDSGDFLELKN